MNAKLTAIRERNGAAPDMEVLRDEAASMSPEVRDQEIRRWLGLSLEGLCRVAVLLAAKRDAGEDVAALGLGDLAYCLLRVADGQALPQLVQKMWRISVALLKKMVGFDMRDQERVVQGDLPLVTFLGGQRTVIRADPAKMDRDQIKQLFERTGIRSEASQMLYLDKLQKQAALPQPEKVGPFEYHRETKTVKFKGQIIPKETLARLLELLA